MKESRAHPIVARLRRARQQQGRTQTALAADLGYVRHTLIGWEMGYRRPRLEEVDALAAELGFRIVLTPIEEADR